MCQEGTWSANKRHQVSHIDEKHCEGGSSVCPSLLAWRCRGGRSPAHQRFCLLCRMDCDTFQSRDLHTTIFLTATT
ncbi:hypothetical protein E2C01_073936 [Portunus trituberculatus]|uniref:Uncharacterized protein n=1 Tax=Portunus trituberculatus TaxID=210409 RepID=A0A5B7I4A3_PORTR|nr:hypothetical protein [Portunus trituberculatus]